MRKLHRVIYRASYLLAFIAIFISSFSIQSTALALDVSPLASTSEKLDALDEWLAELNKNSEFNGVVSIVLKGSPVFTKAYGVDGSGESRPLNAHSSFNLASVSKHFTAMAIVLLKSDSKLNYSDTISQYIPELSMYSGVTIKHLLHHTSGLADYIEMAEEFDGEILTTSDVLALFYEQNPSLKFPSGTQFDYSNTGYVLLAEIVARVSGTSFEKFMLNRIFKPLGMDNSQVFNLLSKNNPENRVYGYLSKRGFFRKRIKSNDLNVYDGVVGDGGVYASAHDLVLWHQALANNTLVSNSTYDAAYTPGVLDDGTSTGYGFGWVVVDDEQVEHSGEWQGFSSYIYRNTKTLNFVAILDNSSNQMNKSFDRIGFGSIVYKIMELQASL